MKESQLKNIIEAALMAADTALNIDRLLQLFEHDEEKPSRKGIKKGKIFENLKNTLHDIFDESDVKM